MSTNASTMWEGKYLRMVKRGTWEFVERVGNMSAVVIIAQDRGHVLLVEQYREPLQRRCLELPAGLVGDEDDLGVDETALKELEEETGYTATHVERVGDFFSSPGMVAESYTLVRAHGVAPGGQKSEEDIVVHRVAPEEMERFIATKRKEGVAVDTKLLLLLGSSILR